MTELPIWEKGVRQSGLMNRDVAKQNLLDFKKVFGKYDIKFVLAFGTLLGAVRERNFIINDSDTDVVCFQPDYLKVEAAFKELDGMGFFIPRVGIPCLDHYLIRNGEKIDINWLLDNGHNEWMYRDWIKWNKKYYNFPENSQVINFLDTEFPVPNNTEQFLVELYGSDWRIPKNKKGFMNA